jgi:superoxide dismutase, Fe-Mn family
VAEPSPETFASSGGTLPRLPVSASVLRRRCVKRRTFLSASLVVGADLLAISAAARPGIADEPSAPTPIAPQTKKGTSKMGFVQPPLPYKLDALKPLFSEEQMTYHYGKHHAAYVAKLNTLLAGKPELSEPLRSVVLQSSGVVFNNAAQAWNHTFFWSCMSPGGGGEPGGELAAAITRDFGSFDAFRKEYSEKAVALFGSGWTWLAKDKQGKLEILTLSNADTPLKHDREPVLTTDVWEHTYYIDYRNERPRFVDTFWSKVNWESAEKNYAAKEVNV